MVTRRTCSPTLMVPMLDRLTAAERHLAAARATYAAGNARLAVVDLELAVRAAVDALGLLVSEVCRGH